MQRKTLLFIAIVLLLAIAGFFGFRLLLPKGSADRIIIRQDGNVAFDVPLNKNTEIPVHSQWGYNLIVIQDGAVWVKEADCPDKLCISQGHMDALNIKTRAMGSTIVCLPHRLSITLSNP